LQLPRVLLGLSLLGLLMALPSESICYAQSSTLTPTVKISLMEAVQSVLDKHPLIRFQASQIDVDRGLKQQASAAFDTVLSATITQGRTTTPLTAESQEQFALIGVQGSDDETTDLTQGSFGISRLFRSGIAISPTLSLTRNVDNLASPQGLNNATPSVQITIPLLRGRGRKAVAAQEIAATIEVDAATFDLTQEVSQLLTTAASDYWNLVAAAKLLVIAQDGENRAHTDLENTQALVDADRLPRDNLNAVNANLAQSASTRILAEQSLVTAQYQLASDMGLKAQDIVASLPLPTDDFPPSGQLRAVPNADILRAYVRDSLQSRSDYLAARLRIDEQKALVTAAKNHLLPQLNLNANGGYMGLKEGKQFSAAFTSLGSGVDGPTASGGVSYNFAPKNDAARGAFLQTSAAETQLELQSEQLSHTISVAVATAFQAAYDAGLQTEKTQKAVFFYRSSLEGERDKYHVGMASVIDVLESEDRLTGALTAEVQAQLSYALALSQFRFATGSLIAPGKPIQTIDSNIFITLPMPASLLPKP
jgi:outer membrane protein TolC